MDHNNILKTIDKIKLGNISIKEKKIVIPVLYDDSEINIKLPKNENKYFELHELNHVLFDNPFKYYINLELMENMDNFEEDYKDDHEKIYNQKKAIEFNDFVIKLKDKLIKTFFDRLKIDKNYLSMVDFNNLYLENHELDRSIWDEHIDSSYIPEIKELKEKKTIINKDIEEENEDVYISIRHRFHVNKNTQREKDFVLKCNIIFKNEELEDKKHIYINWYII